MNSYEYPQSGYLIALINIFIYAQKDVDRKVTV